MDYIQRNSNSESVFYPYGVFGRGYVLPNNHKENEVRQFVRLWFIVSTATYIIVGVFAPSCVLALLAVLTIWYRFKIAKLSTGLPAIQDRREVCASFARSQKAATLWILLISSALFTFVGFAMLLSSTTKRLEATACILFFGLCTFGYAYMIKIKAD